MPVRPKTKEFPAEHPIHRGLIIFGRKPPSSSKSPLPASPPVKLSEEKIAQLVKRLSETVKRKPRFTSKPVVDPPVGLLDESL